MKSSKIYLNDLVYLLDEQNIILQQLTLDIERLNILTDIARDELREYPLREAEKLRKTALDLLDFVAP